MPEPTSGQQVVTFCNMDVLSGGWTLAQRTVWDFMSSSLLITNYASFYQQSIGAPAPGSAFRLAGRYWPILDTGRDHLIVVYPRATDGSRCSALYYMATGGSWTVPAGGGATLTNVTQSVTLFDATAFSTTDDGPGQLCVNQKSAVPWTYSNCCSTCPTFGGGYFTPARPAADYLMTADALGKTIVDSCGAATPLKSAELYGLDVMEYYLR
jgi:hypothetical protein